MCLASWPMLQAVNSIPTNAMLTESGSAPAAKAAPRGMDAAIAAPGAMDVMDWNSTSIKPTAFRSSCATGLGSVTADSSRSTEFQRRGRTTSVSTSATLWDARAGEAKDDQPYDAFDHIPKSSARIAVRLRDTRMRLR